LAGAPVLAARRRPLRVESLTVALARSWESLPFLVTVHHKALTHMVGMWAWAHNLRRRLLKWLRVIPGLTHQELSGLAALEILLGSGGALWSLRMVLIVGGKCALGAHRDVGLAMRHHRGRVQVLGSLHQQTIIFLLCDAELLQISRLNIHREKLQDGMLTSISPLR
jgi:hypothetical protein